MATDKYAKTTLLIDGVQQLEVQSQDIEFNAGLQRVDTIPKGYAGNTSGSGEVTINGTQAVPFDGLEFDVLSAIANESEHEVEFTIGGKSYSSTGQFLNGRVSQSVNGSTEVSWTWMGDLVPLN